MRLIDADFALSRVKPYSSDDENWTVTGGTAIRLIHNAINDAPSIDAVPVVRCKECNHYEPCEGGNDFCCLHRIGVVKDDFCSYGERKDGAE